MDLSATKQTQNVAANTLTKNKTKGQMIGGGFLGQMHETMKKNRDMVRDSLGKTKRKAFDNGQYPSSGDKNLLDTGANLTDSQRQELIAQIKEEQRRETIKKILILLFTVLFLTTIYLGLHFFIE